MKKLLMLGPLILVLLVGCAGTHAPRSAASVEDRWISPQQAVFLAATAAPAGVEGIYAMKVEATGTQGNHIYLNSELDYRDQRNLTVAISPSAAEQLAERFGEHPVSALKGQAILVRGSAIRTKIYFFANGRMTNKYYYQTHVNVRDADQITVR